MKKLQDFSFDKSRYERTSQKNVCGWSVFGKSCQIGPDENGNCQAQYECVPYKNGDRWSCTRSGNNGGRCEQGPTADGICRHKSPRCVPLNSIRQSRGKLILWLVVFSVMTLVFVILTPLNDILISPGELTIKHSLKNNDCVQCHVTDSSSPADWFANAFVSVPVQKNNQKCLSCHELGFYAALPHSLAPDLMTSITKNTVSDNVSSLRLFVPAGVDLAEPENSEIACMSCHREHKGRDHDITRLDNTQCSSCHVNEHKNFVSEHPEFSDYPYNRRQRIVFDHAGHISDYFAKEKLKMLAPKTCASCHQLDISGRYMQAKSFELTCMSCHSKDVIGEKLEVKGFPVISIPAIDLSVLSGKGLNIGQWPAELEDEELTGIMMFLLSPNKEIQPLLEMISKGEIELFDLAGKDEKVLKQVQLLAWEIKRLLSDIVAGGHNELLKRIQKAGNISTSEITAKLAGKLPLSLLADIQKSWFPALKKEIELYKAKQFASTSSVNTRSLSRAVISNEDWAKAGGWYADELSLFYRPGGHADEFIYSWLEIVRRKGDSSALKLAAFKQLSYDKLPGQCTKCHSVDPLKSETIINWRGYRYEPEVHKFTDFNHKAHFSISDKSGCEKCHEIDLKADFLAAYKNHDLQTFSSNWKSLNKSTCASCHTSEAAGDDCTLCHNYHVGRFDVNLPASSITSNAVVK